MRAPPLPLPPPPPCFRPARSTPAGPLTAISRSVLLASSTATRPCRGSTSGRRYARARSARSARALPACSSSGAARDAAPSSARRRDAPKAAAAAGEPALQEICRGGRGGVSVGAQEGQRAIVVGVRACSLNTRDHFPPLLPVDLPPLVPVLARCEGIGADILEQSCSRQRL
jgi:hypothetical protein